MNFKLDFDTNLVNGVLATMKAKKQKNEETKGRFEGQVIFSTNKIKYDVD